MIRRFQDGDLEAVMSIWLNANMEAHDFVDPEYWRRNYAVAETMIPQAEVYVSEENCRINGFIGVMDDYIAGIFVDRSARGGGIGSQLLRAVPRNKLSLKVYKKNSAAVSFYLHRGFQAVSEQIDPATSETEYFMSWER